MAAGHNARSPAAPAGAPRPARNPGPHPMPDPQPPVTATPTPDEARRLRPRGSRQGGLREYNERVVLHAIRLHGALPSADIARLTQLTAQTVSLITKRLVDDGLLRKGAPQRGKVGQPSVPLSLDPEGAWSVGIEIGRRSMDVLLVDFTGRTCERSTLEYRFPDPQVLLPEIGRRLAAWRRKLGPQRRERVQGVGLAAPLAVGGWQQLLGMPPEVAARWHGLDLRAQAQSVSPWPVTVIKDTAAACVAELVGGLGRQVHSYLYLFVDTFIGGGLVLDSQLWPGRSGNAGAVGSMALWPAREPPSAAPAQLLAVASLLNLEQAWAGAGLAIDADRRGLALAPPWHECTQRWLAQAGPAIAQAINAGACLLDLDAVILDGSFSRDLLGALMAATQAALPRYSWEGVAAPRLMPGTIGPDARALGGALLPLHANFAPDRELFLKVVG